MRAVGVYFASAITLLHYPDVAVAGEKATDLPGVRVLQSAFPNGEMSGFYPHEMTDAKGNVFKCDIVPEGTKSKPTKKRGPGALSALKGFCASYTPGGWWTYEWCYQKSIEQYHLVQGTMQRNPNWSLGAFKRTETVTLNSDGTTSAAGSTAGAEGTASPPKSIAGVAPASDAAGSLVVIRDYHGGGQRCDETGSPRHSVVRYGCCEAIAGSTGDGGLAQVLSVTETELCAYEVTVCTPLLCGEAVNVTVMQLLAAGPDCFLPRRESWWTYEFCYGKHVRQYHATEHLDSNGKVIIKVDSEYLLGLYNETAAAETIGPANLLEMEDGRHQVAMEYGGGTLCDVSPEEAAAAAAADAAAAAADGDGGKNGGRRRAEEPRRSTTVLFRCGGAGGAAPSVVSVREDTTCHYEVVVASPLLCRHPALVRKPPATVAVVCTESDKG